MKESTSAARTLALMRSGDTLAAMKALRDTTGEDPVLLLNKALYHAAQGLDPERLLRVRAQQQARLPGSQAHPRAVLLYNLGCLALVQDEVSEACMLFQEAVRLDADNARALHNLGYANELLAEFDLALSAYKQALALEPDQVLTRINLALLQAQTGEAEAGLAALREMGEADPDNAGVALYLSRTLLREGGEDDLAEALAVLERCPETAQSPELLECQAFAEWRLGQYEQAERTFRALLVDEPDNAFARLGLMHVLAERGDYAGVMEHTEAYHRLQPSDRTQRLLERLGHL